VLLYKTCACCGRQASHLLNANAIHTSKHAHDVRKHNTIELKAPFGYSYIGLPTRFNMKAHSAMAARKPVLPLAKRARGDQLLEFESFRRGVPRCSAHALGTILRKCRDEGVPDLVGNNVATEAQRYKIERDTPYGAVLRTIWLGDGDKRIELAHPIAYLWTLCRDGGGYSDLVRRSLEDHGPSPANPWKLALYSDEVTPGNVIAPDNLRKLWVVYWAMVSLHRQFISNVMAICLEQFFTGGANDCATCGFTLDFPDGSVWRLHFDLDQVVQDDAAHKFVWNCIGASGTRFCMKCQNIRARSFGDTDPDDGAEVLCSDIVKVDQLHFATEASVREAFDKLDAYSAAGMTGGKLREREQALGFKLQPSGIMRNVRLRRYVKPTKQFVHDYMHVLAVQGVIQVTLFLCLMAFDTAGVSVATVRGYVEMWRAPTSMHIQVGAVLSDKRMVANRKAKRVKCQASEAWALLPLVAMFAVFLRKQGIAVEECTVLIVLADVTDLLSVTPRGAVDRAKLDAKVEEFLAQFKATFPAKCMITKFHAMLHFGEELEEHDMLLTCWVMERKNILARWFATNLKNTQGFERSCLENITCQQLFNCSDPASFNYDSGLIRPKVAPCELTKLVREEFPLCPPTAVVYHARFARFAPWGRAAVGDVVLVRESGSFIAGWIWKNLSIYLKSLGGHFSFLLVQLADLVGRDPTDGTATWRLRDDPEWCPLSEVIEVVTYSWINQRDFRTLLNCLHR
jgi:hypothetical protein